MRSADASAPLIVSGDGEGLVDLASIGALERERRGALLGAPSPTTRRGCSREVAQPNSVLVVTDSNRKRARRWTSVRDTAGATERVDETALANDENDNRLDVFPDAGTDAQTVVQTPGRRGEHEPATATRVRTSPSTAGRARSTATSSTQWEVGAHAQGDRRRRSGSTSTGRSPPVR